MGSNDELAARVRLSLRDVRGIQDKAMFGGIGFMLNDHLLVGASKRGLLVRVGPDQYADALAGRGARPMSMKGRSMTGYVFVDPAELGGRALEKWLRMGMSFVETLPPKAKATTSMKRRRTATAGGAAGKRTARR